MACQTNVDPLSVETLMHDKCTAGLSSGFPCLLCISNIQIVGKHMAC